MRGVLHLLQEYHSNYSDKKGYYGYYMRKRCGLDVCKETVVACIMGPGIKKEIRTLQRRDQ